MSSNNDDEDLTLPSATSYLGADETGLFIYMSEGDKSDMDLFLYGVFSRAKEDAEFVEDMIVYSIGPTEEDVVN